MVQCNGKTVKGERCKNTFNSGEYCFRHKPTSKPTDTPPTDEQPTDTTDEQPTDTPPENTPPTDTPPDANVPKKAKKAGKRNGDMGVKGTKKVNKKKSENVDEPSTSDPPKDPPTESPKEHKFQPEEGYVGKCKGITKKGEQCKFKAQSNGYCRRHDENVDTDSYKIIAEDIKSFKTTGIWTNESYDRYLKYIGTLAESSRSRHVNINNKLQSAYEYQLKIDQIEKEYDETKVWTRMMFNSRSRYLTTRFDKTDPKRRDMEYENIKRLNEYIERTNPRPKRHNFDTGSGPWNGSNYWNEHFNKTNKKQPKESQLDKLNLKSKSEFRKWMVQNHPDRGGDTEYFQTVMTEAIDKGWYGQ